MRDSPVSASAPLRKLNAVCVLCHLKYFLNYARGTIFRNIEISEYRAFGTLGRARLSSYTLVSLRWGRLVLIDMLLW